MKSLVIYDSTFGNTKEIAHAIAEGIGDGVTIKSVSDATIADFSDIGLLVVGSPVNGFMPTEKTTALLKSLDNGSLRGIRAAAFDTRMNLWIHGDAARKISRQLANKGAEIIAKPNPFQVKGKTGPLAEGEIQRAKEWGASLQQK